MSARYPQPSTLEVQLDGTFAAQRFATIGIYGEPEFEPRGRTVVNLSTEQARELLRRLWRMLPAEERPCP